MEQGKTVRFETLVESAPVCIHEIDSDGRIVSMNPAGLTMLNLDLGTVQGTDYLNYVGDTDRERVADLMRRAIEDGESAQFEFRTQVDGRTVHFSSGLVPLRDVDGRLDGLMGITQDMTDIREAEAALIAGKQRLREFAEIAADYFWEMDSSLHLVEPAEGLAAMSGVSADCLRGLSGFDTWWEFTGSEPPEELLEHFRSRTEFRSIESTVVMPDCSSHVIEWSGAPIQGPSGEFLGYRGTGRNVTHEHRLVDQLSFRETHDTITGLFNRTEFERRLDETLRGDSGNGVGHVLLLLDLHRFNLINDSCGHAAGDMILCEVAQLLESLVPANATVARVGGDEFAVLLQVCSEKRGIDTCESILAGIDEYRAFWENHTLSVAASAGVVPVSGTDASASEVMVAADAACWSAKNLGRNRHSVIRLDDDEYWQRQELVRDDMRTVTMVSDAFRQDRFRLYAHEIVPLNAPPVSGSRFEVLIRMLDGDDQPIPPGRFLPVAERYGLITRIDSWVLETAIDMIEGSRRGWPGIEMCNINLSGASLGDESFLHHVVTQLQRPGVEPSRICFEITETAAIANLESAIWFLSSLRDIGCKFALDDFGTGLSSFEYLKKLPVDYLKIDGEFVRDIVHDPADRAIVRAIADVGASMGKQIIAEWAENEEILAVLGSYDIDYTQGYVHGQPSPLADLL